MNAETIVFQELDGDQAREAINAQQRYDAFQATRKRVNGAASTALMARMAEPP